MIELNGCRCQSPLPSVILGGIFFSLGPLVFFGGGDLGGGWFSPGVVCMRGRGRGVGVCFPRMDGWMDDGCKLFDGVA